MRCNADKVSEKCGFSADEERLYMCVWIMSMYMACIMTKEILLYLLGEGRQKKNEKNKKKEKKKETKRSKGKRNTNGNEKEGQVMLTRSEEQCTRDLVNFRTGREVLILDRIFLLLLWTGSSFLFHFSFSFFAQFTRNESDRRT